MSRMPGLPVQGTDVTLHITRVYMHPLCVFAEFWGKFSEERNVDYQWLAKDVQSPGNKFHEGEGKPGDQCLVQVGLTWHRSHIVSRTESHYKVFLIDKGEQCHVTTSDMAWGRSEHFHLPPEVEFCLLANVLPLSPENRWSPTALDFLRTLSGKSVKAYVQDVLVPQRTVLLSIPCIADIMCEMGFAKRLYPKDYRDFVFASLLSDSKTSVYSATQHQLTRIDLQGAKEPLHKQQLFTYPDLELGTVERVVITEVTNPQQVFCQLKVFAFALKTLSEKMTECYEGTVARCNVSEMVGFPCAARGSDGKWYRSVLQDVCQADQVVKVLAVDSGKNQFVRVENVRKLAADFFQMPVVTYMCSLNGIIDKGVRWAATQIADLRRFLFNRTLSAKFESQNVSEGVHYVTLYDNEDKYLHYLLSSEKCFQDEPLMGLTSHTTSNQHPDRAHRLTDRPADTITETHKQPKTKMTTQSAIVCDAQNPDAKSSVVCRGSGHTVKIQSTFVEQMFPIGSDLEVTVSCIESPNDFWCQLAQSRGELKSLMYHMQSYYEGSKFEGAVEMACVARNPDNGTWYRALIIHQHKVPHVDVLFVDYGQKQTVSLYDLRRIQPEFQTLKGQAFRCSLLNPIDASSVINDWSEEAVVKFNDFVEMATSKYSVLKCTVYAVTYNEQNIVFNVVDLATPFENVCTQMVNLNKCVTPEKASGPSFRLNTFYYSTHNIKTGMEEKVTVTSVDSVTHFYCQLERNADVMKDIDRKVNNLCHQLENIKFIKVFGTLCFARYTDGRWYRAQIKAIEPSLVVHFVDYGDTIEVSKSAVLPIPKEATDIMSVPVQAVKCGLAGVPANVSKEANSWFESDVMDCKFKALVVAREPDGKLLVELYLGNTQVNSKIRKMLNTVIPREERVIFSGRRVQEVPGDHNPTLDFSKQPVEDRKPMLKLSTQRPLSRLSDEKRSADINIQFGLRPPRNNSGCRVKADSLPLYTPPGRRHLRGTSPTRMGSNPEPANANVKQIKSDSSIDFKQFRTTKLSPKDSQRESYTSPEAVFEELPKLTDLPSQLITAGMEADVFVSHCDSPLSFCVQFVKDKVDLDSLVEKLNKDQTTQHITHVKAVHPGDIVQAEFPDDSSWYRAVVRDRDDSMTLVEFVDFGNTALIPITKINRLHKPFLDFPPYCTHCMLNKAAGLREDQMLDPDVVLAFKRTISDNAEKDFKCRFIRRSGSVWVVELDDGGMDVMCTSDPDSIVCKEIQLENLKERENETMPQDSYLTQLSVSSEATTLNGASLRFHEYNMPVGQHLQAYVACFNNDQSFWCQSADSDELDKITTNVSVVGSAADPLPLDGLSPGSPCIALFSEDELWYRAEVISQDEENLSVLFVDYGNKSQVKVRDVRRITPVLLKTPTQAFLCELEGFDVSHGSWDSDAADVLSALTTDKLLEMTVLGVTRDEGKMKYLVEIECEGQAINKNMETFWRTSVIDNNNPDGIVEQIAVPDAQPPEEQEDDHSAEMEADMHTERNNEEEPCDEGPTEPDTTETIALNVTSSPHNGDYSENESQQDSNVVKEVNIETADGGEAHIVSDSEEPKDEDETLDSEWPEPTTSTSSEATEIYVLAEEDVVSPDDRFDQLEDAITPSCERPELSASTLNKDVEDDVLAREAPLPDDSSDDQLEAETPSGEQDEEDAVFGDMSLPTEGRLEEFRDYETLGGEQLELKAYICNMYAEEYVLAVEVSEPTGDGLDQSVNAELSDGEQLDLTAFTQDQDLDVGLCVEMSSLPADGLFPRSPQDDDECKVAESSDSEQLELSVSTEEKEAANCDSAEEEVQQVPVDDSLEEFRGNETLGCEQLELKAYMLNKYADEYVLAVEVSEPTGDRLDQSVNAESSDGEPLELTALTQDQDVDVGVCVEKLPAGRLFPWSPQDDTSHDECNVAESSDSEQVELEFPVSTEEDAANCESAEEQQVPVDDSLEALLTMVSHLSLTVVGGLDDDDVAPL